ncbi:PREDICTED: uncharacterized protein LOC108566161 [Nicrophorus vespilloides]|uniref:Uncharacterized protein LOC108566161 n=1 Tax=Nicrophorus vespilloides TaxID=110193 RepID=A0ABM1N3K8_NICVS|nr:PREDICTED: uncharacterized protein LOC108566161 [Nicrophorus vespilloides]
MWVYKYEQLSEIIKLQNKMIEKTVVLVVLGLVVSSQGCMDYESCVVNIENAVNAATDTMSSYSQESEDLSNTINENMLAAVSKLNEDIQNGPINCQKYSLPKPAISYVENLFELCPSTYVGEADAEVESKITSFPSDFMEINTAEEREYYCTYIVPGMNFYCNRLRTAIDDFKNCDLLKMFDEAYRMPWEQCINL